LRSRSAEAHQPDGKTYKPERTIVSALSTPKVADATMTGTGGAFKSKGQMVSVLLQMPDHRRPYENPRIQLPDRRADPPEKWEPHGLW